MFHPTRLLFLTASFFCGLSFAFMYPLLSLYLVDELGASALQMGIFLAIQVSAGVAVATYLGKRSDQGMSRKNIIVVAQIGFTLAMLVFIFTRNYYTALLAALLFLSVGAATLPQMFTMGRLYSDKHLQSGGSLFMSLLRAAIAVAWVVGPPLAFFIQGKFGFSQAFIFAAVCAVLMLMIALLLPETEAPNLDGVQKRSAMRWQKSPAIVLYLLTCLLLFSTCNMYVVSLPLYVSKEMLLDTQWAGYLMGFAAFLEIPLMVLAGIYGPKFGYRRLIFIGLFSGALFYAGVSLSTGIVPLVLLQIFNAVFVAITATLGMILIQDMMKHEMGLATTLFSSSQQLAALLGNLLVGLVAQYISYHAIYVVAMLMLVIAIIAFFTSVRAERNDEVLAAGAA